MGDEVLARIEAWQAAGLIDPETAARLRADEATRAPAETGQAQAGTRHAANAFFGPPVTIAELFAFIGSAFLLSAWHVLAPSIRYDEAPDLGVILVRWLIPAIAFGVLGFLAAGGSPRLGRAAGVAFAVATAHVFGGLAQLLQPSSSLPIVAVEVTGLTAVAAIVFRRIRPAVLTQVTLLITLIGSAVALFDWARITFFGERQWDSPPETLVPQAMLTIGWWLAWAFVLGFIARFEWRIGEDAPEPRTPDEELAARRGSFTRFFAGITAVSGTMVGALVSGDGGRALEPAVGDGLVLLVSAGLLAIAIRFGTLVYLLPAALGFIAALTDLNAQYVAERTGTGAALIIEGLILMGTGFVAERVRRGMAARKTGTPPAAGGPPENAPTDEPVVMPSES